MWPREAVVPDDVFFGNPEFSEQYRCQDAGPVLADGAVKSEGMVCRRGDNFKRCQDFLAEFPAPRAVPSQASFVKAGRNWVLSVSGGIQIFPWQVADRTQVSDKLAAAKTEKPTGNSWYWQR